MCNALQNPGFDPRNLGLTIDVSCKLDVPWEDDDCFAKWMDNYQPTPSFYIGRKSSDRITEDPSMANGDTSCVPWDDDVNLLAWMNSIKSSPTFTAARIQSTTYDSAVDCNLDTLIIPRIWEVPTAADVMNNIISLDVVTPTALAYRSRLRKRKSEQMTVNSLSNDSFGKVPLVGYDDNGIPISPEISILKLKLSVLDVFFTAFNERNKFSLYALAESQCISDICLHSRSCCFCYHGWSVIAAFWLLLLEKHTNAKVKVLSSRIHSSTRSKMSSSSESSQEKTNYIVEYVLKIEGMCLTEFPGFVMFKALIDANGVHSNMSMPQFIANIEKYCALHHRYIQSRTSNDVIKVIYLLEMLLQLDEEHKIQNWQVEILAAETIHVYKQA